MVTGDVVQLATTTAPCSYDVQMALPVIAPETAPVMVTAAEPTRIGHTTSVVATTAVPDAQEQAGRPYRRMKRIRVVEADTVLAVNQRRLVQYDLFDE